MKIFIDLGAYNGDSLAAALELYRGFDAIYAFEPLEENFRELEKAFGGKEGVSLYPAAADVKEGDGVLYLGAAWGDEGGSLCREKNNCSDETRPVKTVDISQFIKERFSRRDKVILKMDVEGKEYEILEKMLKDGTIALVDTIFCEWHDDRMGLPRQRHDALVAALNRFGFGLTGENYYDEFTCVVQERKRIGVFRFAADKRLWFLKIFLKRRCPALFDRLKRARDAFRRMAPFLRKS